MDHTGPIPWYIHICFCIMIQLYSCCRKYDERERERGSSIIQSFEERVPTVLHFEKLFDLLEMFGEFRACRAALGPSNLDRNQGRK